MRRLACLALVVLPLGLGCSSQPSPGSDCGGAEPAFRVTITSSTGALPVDTRVKVTYGAGVEEYVLAHPVTGKSVLCTQSGDDGGDGGVTELSCDLWTNGAAEVEVKAAGYLPVDQSLVAVGDTCGVRRTDVAIELDKPD